MILFNFTSLKALTLNWVKFWGAAGIRTSPTHFGGHSWPYHRESALPMHCLKLCLWERSPLTALITTQAMAQSQFIFDLHLHAKPPYPWTRIAFLSSPFTDHKELPCSYWSKLKDRGWCNINENMLSLIHSLCAGLLSYVGCLHLVDPAHDRFWRYTFVLMVDCCLSYLTFWLSGSVRTQLFMSSSGFVITWCPMIRHSISIQAQQHAGAVSPKNNSPSHMSWPCSRSLGVNIAICSSGLIRNSTQSLSSQIPLTP